MKVLVLGNAVGLGGAQTAFRRFVEFLVRDGVEVATLPLCDGNSGFSSELKSTILHELRFSTPTKAARFAKALHTARGAWLARRFAPDIFISVGLARSANFVARALRPSCFKIAHDFIFGRSKNDPLLQGAASAFDAIGVQSPAMVTALTQAGFSSRPVNWIPCIPEAPIAGFGKGSPEKARDNVRLAYFGRLAANKGLDLLFEALSCAHSVASVGLDIWGSGPLAEHLKKRCDGLGLAQRVNFLGPYPSGAAGANLLCGYDAIILPSTGGEGLPLILLEAMAYGVPFLVTNVGAIGDCCKDNADSILVDVGVDSLRCGLQELVRRVMAQEFRPERLRQYYACNFAYDVLADRWRRCLSAPHAFFNA